MQDTYDASNTPTPVSVNSTPLQDAQNSQSNPPISLECNSLYIATYQLPDTPGQGFFHWSLYLTDSFGKATKYHWVEQPKRLVRITGYAEDVAFGPMDPFNSFSDNMTMRVGLFKIDGVAPVEPTVMYQLAMNAFNTRGYPTVEGNRRHGLSCCTWVRQVLIKLYQRGYIQRNERFSSRKIENAVRDRSLQLEQDLARGQLVQPGVMTI
ncbi:hypothetical protein FISHEDRAFT_68455 [Fistulina hepatica ATCC 64428]|uniref:Uncharacterized protein n=1 Tax=Fistulina hepatica ATCC 64428 TaxID=1128425 RepID=A0A0D7ARC9_9AGAR|nr:hypothetical protein FISHEDRAFT_68455 [Fistulina hepatica ATCC 64428]